MESPDVAEIKRHFSVVAEGLETKIQLVADRVSALHERWVGSKPDMRSVDGRLTQIEDRMTAFERKMERGFDEVKAMLKS